MVIVVPFCILLKNISKLSPRLSTSLILIIVDSDCVAEFHIICPEPGSPEVIFVLAT